jgi:hypothetical protein
MGACNKLIQDEISNVGAIRKLKADMVTISHMVEAQLLQELHSRIFLTTHLDTAAAAAGGGGGGTAAGSSGGYGGSSGGRLAQQQQQQQQQLLGGGAGQRAFDATSGGSIIAAGSSSSSMPGFVLDALQGSSSAYPAAAGTGGPGSGPGSSAAAAAAASGTVGDLVSCLMLLDALDDAKMYLLLHARAGVRQMILR